MISMRSNSPFLWTPNSKVLVLACLLFPLLIALGFWQLSRADEKATILEQFKQNQSYAPVNINTLNDNQDLQYRSVFVDGIINGAKRVFLDYRVKNNIPGYEVYEPLTFKVLNSEKLSNLLVNRGWVPASLDRDILPELKSIPDKGRFFGTLYRKIEGGISLDDGIDIPDRWPVRLGSIDVDRAKVIYQSSDFFSYQLRLDEGSLAAFESNWVTVSVDVSKHIGYAFQWFAMSFVLLIMTVFSNSNAGEWIKSRFKP